MKRRGNTIALVQIGLMFLLVFLMAQRAAAAPVPPPTDQPVAPVPVLTDLERLAQSYWIDRGVVLPEPVQVFSISDVYAIENNAAAYGDLSGNEVWLTEGLLKNLDRHNHRMNEIGRLELCPVYLHERGHNAGFDHDAGWLIMRYGYDNFKIPQKCKVWAKNWR